MNEDFVNEEITRKLIDKGCPVRLVIKADECIPILYELPKKHPDWRYCKAWYIPTISQVLKWLREEKKIYLEVVIAANAEYMCDIYKINPRPIKCLGSTGYSKTYEAAALAGIGYVIDNLI